MVHRLVSRRPVVLRPSGPRLQRERENFYAASTVVLGRWDQTQSRDSARPRAEPFFLNGCHSYGRAPWPPSGRIGVATKGRGFAGDYVARRLNFETSETGNAAEALHCNAGRQAMCDDNRHDFGTEALFGSGWGGPGGPADVLTWEFTPLYAIWSIEWRKLFFSHVKTV